MNARGKHWLQWSALIVVGIAGWWAWERSEGDPIGPIPDRGYDLAPIDYSAPRYPDAPVVEVPLFDAESGLSEPGFLSLPPMGPKEPLGFAGEIIHPNESVTGSVVQVIFTQPDDAGDDRREGGMQGVATGESGRLSYRLEGTVPSRSGQFDVSVDVHYPITDSDIDTLPVEQRMTHAIVARGVLIVREH